MTIGVAGFAAFLIWLGLAGVLNAWGLSQDLSILIPMPIGVIGIAIVVIDSIS